LRADQHFKWIAPFLLLLLVSSQVALASEFCGADSEIGQVRSFIDQAYHDIQRRKADPEGQRCWDSRLEELNARNCRSGNPGSLAGNCEWSNAAQIIVEMLNTPESVSKNGRADSNRGFVAALYRVLLQREPDETGLRAHVGTLESGGSRANDVLNFLSGDEYRNRFHCQPRTRELAPVSTGGRPELGVNGHPLTQIAYSDSKGVSFDDQLTEVQNLGAKWYRIDVHIGSDFTTLDLLLKKAQAHGVQLLPVIFPPIDLAHDSASTLYQKSHDSAFNIVSHFKSSIHVWELANETDIYCMTRAGDPGWRGGAPGGDQVTDYNDQRYAAIKEVLRGLADGVRSADSSAQRIVNFGGWLHTGFVQRLANDGVPYDIVGIHWYQDMAEITCPGQNYPCPAKLQHFNVVQRVESITNGKPIWITETNYRPVPSNSLEANMARHQSYLESTLQRWMNQTNMYPFQVIIIYELLDEPNHPDVSEQQYGMVSVTPRPGGGYSLGSPKPAYQSVQRFSK